MREWTERRVAVQLMLGPAVPVNAEHAATVDDGALVVESVGSNTGRRGSGSGDKCGEDESFHATVRVQSPCHLDALTHSRNKPNNRIVCGRTGRPQGRPLPIPTLFNLQRQRTEPTENIRVDLECSTPRLRGVQRLLTEPAPLGQRHRRHRELVRARLSGENLPHAAAP